MVFFFFFLFFFSCFAAFYLFVLIESIFQQASLFLTLITLMKFRPHHLNLLLLLLVPKRHVWLLSKGRKRKEIEISGAFFFSFWYKTSHSPKTFGLWMLNLLIRAIRIYSFLSNLLKFIVSDTSLIDIRHLFQIQYFVFFYFLHYFSATKYG